MTTLFLIAGGAVVVFLILALVYRAGYNHGEECGFEVGKAVKFGETFLKGYEAGFSIGQISEDALDEKPDD
jgi:hypothetical protein